MKVSLDLYNVFYTVAKEGSISAAAKVLFISQPAITIQIKKLEEVFSISLFTRTKRGMVLTDEGKILFEYVKNGLDCIDNGENALLNLKNLERGCIRIGVSTTICRHVLMPYLVEFHNQYPNIDIQINNNTSDDLLKELRKGNLDILLMFLPSHSMKDLQIIPVLQVQDIFVGNNKYAKLTKGNNDISKIKEFPLIFPSYLSSSRKHLNNYLKDNNIDLTPKLEVVSYNLIIDLLKGGFGIGYVTREFIKKELLDKSLYEIKITPNIPKRTIVLISMDKKEPNYCAKKLIELIKNSRHNN